MEEEKNYEIETETEEERQRRLRRKQRIQEMQREKKRAQMRQKCVIPGVVIAVAVMSVSLAVSAAHKQSAENNVNGGVEGGTVAGRTPEADSAAVYSEPLSTADNEPASTAGSEASAAENGGPKSEREIEPASETYSEPSSNPEVYGPFPTESPKEPVFSAESTASTNGFGDEIISQYGILIDTESKEILAQREAKTRMNPASMTKILTVLTAADELGLTGEDWEKAEVLDDTFTITIEITDYSYVNDCSNVGFEVGEEVTVRDLFYGTVLPSGGDAALGLACYVAGSQEAFVELMNKKLEELGLSETSHFTNCVGLYDTDHYSTVYDMAVMLQTAADSGFCRDVLSAHTYNTSQTEQHPEGLLISNWFLRRIEDKDTHGEVICGKTGYVVQSGSCAASLASDSTGREYLCVTAGSSSSWQCIYDQVALYQKYLVSE